MKSSAKKIELASVDDLFSTEEGRQDAKLEKIQEIPLSELHPFKNHPFKVKDDEAMMETADSIKQYGVLVPAIARPDPEGGYELVAGHRRHRASELAEKETMPVIVRDLDDDAATIIMVDSNLQRESLLPSERAFAYKMKLDAMKHPGERVDLTCSQVGNKLEGKKSSEILAEQVGQSKNQIFRYIRLTELISELMDMVDIICAFLSFSPYTMLVVSPLWSLLAAITYFLVAAKTKKPWALFIFCAVTGIYGFYPPMIICCIIAGIISALIAWKTGCTNGKTLTFSYIIYMVLAAFSGTYIPFLFFSNQTLEQYAGMFGESYLGILQTLVSPVTAIIMLVVVAICAFVGALIAKKLLKKHFKKAGMV